MAKNSSEQQGTNPQEQSKPASAGIDMSIDLAPGRRVQITLETQLPGEPPRLFITEVPSQEALPVLQDAPIPGRAIHAAVPLQTLQQHSGKSMEIPIPPGRSQTQPAKIKESQTRELTISAPKCIEKTLSLIRRSPAQFLFILAMLIYFVTRVINLADYPIFFFCDEAILGNLAADLVRDGFRDYWGTLLPAYFKDGSGPFCLSTTVYLQVIPTLIFGKQVFVTRIVEVLVGLLAPYWLGLTLRDIFKVRYWWYAPLALAAVPGWFIFSRTAYGIAMMAGFYAGFLYFYLLYRLHNPRYLYPALLMGALTFYTYASGQSVMLVSGLFLLVLDWQHHWQNRKTALRGLALLVLLALPQIRFVISRPNDYAERFQLYSSYWIQNITLTEKIGEFINRYLMALNPAYLFFPGLSDDELTYVMKGYGALHWLFLPFVLIGIIWCVRKWRQPETRALFVAILASPTNAAMVTITFRREISLIVPVIILTVIGISAAINWLIEKTAIKPYTWLNSSSAGGLAAILLTTGAIGLTWDALVNGPTWFNNYGLSGMQFGARQVFAAAKDFQEKHPSDNVFLSPNWTFQMDQVIRFFLPDDTPIKINTPDRALTYYEPNLARQVFVLTPMDYEHVINSGKIKSIQVEQIIPSPDGKPAFYFGRLAYRDDIQQIFEQELKQRQALHSETIEIAGENLLIRHSQLEGHSAQYAFDGNPLSLIKTREANPLVIEIEFPQAQTLKGIRARVGSGYVRLTILLNVRNGQPEKTYNVSAPISQENKDVQVDFGEPQVVHNLRFELLEPNAGTPAIIHLWELWLLNSP